MTGGTTWAYDTNAREQLVRRRQTVGGTSTTHIIHDIFGNIIAETNGTAAGTQREYIWLLEAEIAPTYQTRAQVERPVAVVDATTTMYMVHVDHLNRPLKMTNAAKASVWDAVWLPWGGAHSITGTAILNARLPGQWFRLEAGLHYNWHRSYDPTIGRYTQPDPLGFVDGPSVYGYAVGSPQQAVDPDGRFTAQGGAAGGALGGPAGAAAGAAAGTALFCLINPSACAKVIKDFCTPIYRRLTGGGGGGDDSERCKKVVQACHEKCIGDYVDGTLPGRGSRQPRYRKCVKDCAAAQGCSY